MFVSIHLFLLPYILISGVVVKLGNRALSGRHEVILGDYWVLALLMGRLENVSSHF